MPPARATVVPTPGPCKASAAARRPRQSACPGVPSCSQQPQNTARATGFSHTRQKPKAKSRAPAAWLPAASSLCPERPCRDGGGAQQKVGPLRWPGIEPGSTAWKAAMLTTIPPTLLSPGRRLTPAAGSPQHTLAAAAAASLPRRPVSGRLCAAAGATRSPPASPSAPALRSGRGPPAPPPRGGAPAALRSPGRSLPAAARQRLRPQPRGATRGTQLPAASWPKPFSTGRWARPLPTTTGGHGGRPPAGVPGLREEPTEAAPEGGRAARSGCGRARPWGGQGGRRSALATERPATTKGSGWRAARVEGVGRGQAGPQGGGRTRRALGGQAAGQRATAATKKAVLPPRRGIEPRSPA